MKPRSWVVSVALVVAAAGALAPVAAQAAGGAHAKKPNPLADPTSNTVPSTAFTEACWLDLKSTTASKRACDSAALVDFDHVRAQEGLGPMALPRGFATFSVPSQLLTLVNLERVDRGLIPFAGRSTYLDSIAAQGAAADGDPALPQPLRGNIEGGEWAGGAPSALYDVFDWMYDDGYGSGNEDCTSPTSGACWGHRRNITTSQYSAPLLMGAASAQGNTSEALLFISDDTKDKVNVKPTWATIAKATPVGVSASRVTVTSTTSKTHSAPIVLRSYRAAKLPVTITSGAKYWSVSPHSCAAKAGKTCTVHVHFRSTKKGTHRGVLRVVGTAGARTITLIGHRTAH